MTAHHARVELTATELEAILPVLHRQPWCNYPTVQVVIRKLERAVRMADR